MDPFRAPENPPIGSATGITGVERFGVDTLVWEGSRLIVRSPREMPAWRVGRNRKTAVHFRGRRYAVVATHTEVGKFEYTLELWPERAHELPAREIRYGEAYVKDREEEARMRETMRRQSYGLLPLWPLLGFLPSKWKATLHARFGVEIIASTRRSVLVECLIVFLLMVFLTIYAWTGLDVFTGKFFGGVTTEVVVFFVFFLDLAVRSSILFEDGFPTFGLYEWMLHPELVRVVRKGWGSTFARARRRRRK